MALLAKDIDRVDVARMDRMFIGSHSPDNPRNEKWIETGHWLEGFELIARRIRETDRRLRFRSARNLGRKIEGRAEPLQNKVGDYAKQASILNGTKNVAMLCGDQLWLFALTYLGGNKWQDNRISMITDEGYSSPMQKSFTEFSGYVRNLQIYQVADLRLTNGKLTYKRLASYTADDAYISDVLIKQTGN